MTTEQIDHLLDLYEQETIRLQGAELNSKSRRNTVEILRACSLARRTVESDKERSLMWLGFVQGMLRAMSWYNFDELDLHIAQNEAGQ